MGDFGILSEDILYWSNQGILPYIGGDLNARLGDITSLSQKTLKWRYSKNVDTISNSHGKKIADLCEFYKLLPLNHCIYYSKNFRGNFTYHKAGNKSQIDFLFTNCKRRKYVKDFKILEKGWHMSDHLPLDLTVNLPVDHWNAGKEYYTNSSSQQGSKYGIK